MHMPRLGIQPRSRVVLVVLVVGVPREKLSKSECEFRDRWIRLHFVCDMCAGFWFVVRAGC